MAKITAQDTMIEVQQPSLDLNRPAPFSKQDVKNVAEAGQVLSETFSPKGDPLGAVMDRHIAAYNETISNLESQNQLSNTAIANLNRQTKSKFIQDMIKAGADAKTMNQYMTTVNNVFESDKRFETINKGEISIIKSYGEPARIKVNDAEERTLIAGAEAVGSLSAMQQLHYSKISPEEQEKFKANAARQQFDFYQLDMEADVATAESTIFGWEATQRKEQGRKLEARLLQTSTAHILAEKDRLLSLVMSGQITADEGSAALTDTIDQLAASESAIKLHEDYAVDLGYFGQQLRALSSTTDEFMSLGTSLDNMENELAGLKLANEISVQRTRDGLPANLKQMVNISDILGDNLINFKIISALGKDIDSGEALMWRTGVDTTLREVIAENYDGLAEPTKTTTINGATIPKANIIRGEVFRAMGQYINLNPENATLGPEEIMIIYNEMKASKYWESLSVADKDKMETQYRNFSKMLQKYSGGYYRRFKQRYESEVPKVMQQLTKNIEKE